MSKGVKSNGQNEEAFQTLLDNFDSMTPQDRKEALDWFAEKKDNGKPRMDDIQLPSIVKAMDKFFDSEGHCPAILKRYNDIRLKQGRQQWEKELKSDDTNCKHAFPWQKNN